MPAKERWTAEEDAILVANYRKIRNRKIADMVGRSSEAVTQRALHLGVNMPRGYRPYGGPKGHRKHAHIVTSIYFDDETFNDVVRVAKEDGMSFSRATLQLIEWGLMDWSDAKRRAA